MMMGNQNPNNFTAAQWEELEKQALIYKYIVSGIPVPTHLILSVRTSLYNSSLSNLGAWVPYNQLYQIGGYGRKLDLEPGRCKRTDGKKWRCSKEAYLDSKYCERHMHRGRARSRKPAEFSTCSSSAYNASSSPSTINTKSISSSVEMDSYQTLKDDRYLQGMKDERSVYTTLQKEEETQGQQHCCVIGGDIIKSSEETTSSKQPFQHLFSTTLLHPKWVDVHQRVNTPKPP